MQALSRLSIKPLPTQRRRQAYAHTSRRTIFFPIPWEQHLQQWLVRVYFRSSLRLWLTGFSVSNCTYSSSDQPVHRVMAGLTWKLMETLGVGGNGCSNVCRNFPLLSYAQVHLLLPRGVTKETRSQFLGEKKADVSNEQQKSFNFDVSGSPVTGKCLILNPAITLLSQSCPWGPRQWQGAELSP